MATVPVRRLKLLPSNGLLLGWCCKGRDGLRKSGLPWLGNISLAVVPLGLWDADAQLKAETLPVQAVCCNCLLEDKAMLMQAVQNQRHLLSFPSSSVNHSNCPVVCPVSVAATYFAFHLGSSEVFWISPLFLLITQIL